MTMRKFIIFFMTFGLLCAVPAAAQMSDNAIIAYISQGIASGKSQTQIGNELMAKGVTVSQAKRLMQNYKNSHSGEMTTVGVNNFSSKHKTKATSASRGDRGLYQTDTSLRSDEFKKMKDKKRDDDFDEEDMQNDSRIEPSDSTKRKRKIFGHDIFRNNRLSFEPNENAATPAGYVIGPGDEIVIDVWGVNEVSLNEFVSPEGRINISQVGPVQVSGLTIEQATGKIRTALSKKYSVGGSNPASKMSVTLGNIRTVKVNVLGEVKVPGTYRLSSFSTVFNALYRAGGVKENGSLRNIQVYRNGKLLANADIYELLFNGTGSGNISLTDDDVIIVPVYDALVEVKGGVKRPMFYEAMEGESVEKLLNYAGGFSFDAYHDAVSIQRRDADKGRVYTVKSDKFQSFSVCDGDVLTVYTNTRKEVFENKVEVKGMVVRPGVYAIGGEIATVRQLVEHAGGLLDDAFTSRAQLLREKPDRSLFVKAIPLGEILKGSVPDVMLQKNDVLMISNVNEINVKGDLTINGYVLNPGDYEYAEGITVEDLILLAGGLENGSGARVDVSRRIVDRTSTEASDTLAHVYSFTISDGLVIDGDPTFILKPFDIVSVRKSPTYVEQKRVRVSGEVTFPGEYTLVSNNERLSDLYKRSGEATPNGFIVGAMLKRKISEDERNVRRNMTTLIKRGASKIDSTKFDKLKVSETYSIGINLDKAIANPGGEYDVVLHDGDELIVPSMTNTVRVQGEVMYPNAVSFISGANVRYYVKQSGGFSNEAKRSKVYVVHMNGKVSVGMGAKVNPGCEIVVPARPKDRKLTVGEWLSIGSSAASIATMVATIANIIKK